MITTEKVLVRQDAPVVPKDLIEQINAIPHNNSDLADEIRFPNALIETDQSRFTENGRQTLFSQRTLLHESAAKVIGAREIRPLGKPNVLQLFVEGDRTKDIMGATLHTVYNSDKTVKRRETVFQYTI